MSHKSKIIYDELSWKPRESTDVDYQVILQQPQSVCLSNNNKVHDMLGQFNKLFHIF